jgi:diaminohydroxyphosphoribosylaminopyrimidine deaminase / 5-amino-6-(5-phosphoribosylamino)uracil reductase
VSSPPRSGTAHRDWLRAAIELSRACPPSTRAYSVGAIVVDTGGARLSRAYSRQTGPQAHAEESALSALAGSPAARLAGATLYTSMEPCSIRLSGARPCTDLVIAAGIGRVVFALREPPIFVDCHGVELLQQAGIEVVEVPDLADLVRDVNRAVLGGEP